MDAAGAWAEQVAALFGAQPQGLVPYRRTAAVVDVDEKTGRARGITRMLLAEGDLAR